MTKRKYDQGRFRCLNPHKYKGDPSNIIYRSSWEKRLMMFFDKDPKILEWSSEEFIIWYKNPNDNKMHRYFPDFWVKKINSKGEIDQALIEVKPKSQTIPPKPIEKSKKPTKRLLS